MCGRRSASFLRALVITLTDGVNSRWRWKLQTLLCPSSGKLLGVDELAD